MVRRIAFAAVLLLAAVPYASASELAVRDIQVRLFYHHSGSLSEDVTSEREYPFILWNTSIGAGDAAEPSTAVLVTVVVSGPPGSFEPNRILEFDVEADASKPFYSSLAHLGVFGADGFYHSGFWLNGVTCKSLKLRARMRGETEYTEKNIVFRCGE